MTRHIGQRGPLLREDQVKQALALMRNGQSQKEAARFFGVSPGGLANAIKRYRAKHLESA